MSRRRNRAERVGNEMVIFSIVLLLGVLTMSCGYFQVNIHWIYLGLSVTFTMSFAIFFRRIVRYHKEA
jgi:hypothetical protein